MWGGRFGEPPADILWSYTVDHSDRRLLAVDVTGSIAHVGMLTRQGLLTEEEGAALLGGLRRIQAEVESGEFGFVGSDEDVHTAVERRLGEVVGPIAGKLHTGRSRNDQVALDLRLYLVETAAQRHAQLLSLTLLLADLAETNAGRIVASYTHLQQAQAMSLGHHLAAYAWMLRRDAARFAEVAARLDTSPLGAGAAAGSSLPLDPDGVAAELGMRSVFENSLDAVAARDVVAEYAFCCAQAMATLSRLAEEVVLWSTTEFGWIELADAYATGSSALPHKKNPDIAELARGRAAVTLGHLTSLLGLQKGLPLAYNRDLQEDKAAVFACDEILAGTLEAVGPLVATATFDPPPPSDNAAALHAAERLVERGVPFREAHAAVGKAVAAATAAGKGLGDLSAAELTAADSRLVPDDIVDVATAAAALRSPGSGSPESVRTQVARLRELVQKR